MSDMEVGEAAWREWHEERNATLAADHGWLSLISFDWLSEERSRISHFPGRWYTDGTIAAASFQHGTSTSKDSPAVLKNGEPFAGEAVFELKEDDSDMSFSSGTRVAEVVMRGGRYAVRVRDSSAPTLKAFTGVSVFPYDPRAIVPATFEMFREPVTVMGETARKGVLTTYSLVGDVVFTYAGTECRLAVTGDPYETLEAVFYDATNGTETADWRAVTMPGPQSEEGTDNFVIDFNRTRNFPAAYTPFGTCPKPVKGNRLTVPVRAGEQRPGPWINPDQGLWMDEDR
ncbi:MAG: DUF1684 domain-containing protein [Ancrocorticia sp.]|jgi:Uncharacterized conserved protein|nr:DUF1684 domain-containing protein [Ancrocorticia sp.]MCI1932547.1 DUF1684 domain-containing protein [Ancrocorticia sp.]MCI1963701.1 DUF1684 domain-containing protein [Ancrocorticia sp.]MCI2003058.1 DUF1684 domain-containing protein [Ancrocorticia sp.]MCI2012030.1 DUF1684 domain-containing protein [Ancrocorticia sp.]